MKTKAWKLNLAALFLVGATTPAANAQDKWEFTLAPLYLWATGIEGESQIGPITAPVNITFSDALDNLESILTLHFEANKGQWGVIADTMHIGLAPESTLPTGAALAIDITNNIYELGGIYRPNPSGAVELLFGVRASDFKLETTVAPAPKRTIADESWIDAYIGLRAAAQLSEKWKFMIRGDIGAGDSDFVWNAVATIDYRFTKNFSVLAGYRWLDYDYETGTGASRFTYDVTYQGPALAAVFYW